MRSTRLPGKPLIDIGGQADDPVGRRQALRQRRRAKSSSRPTTSASPRRAREFGAPGRAARARRAPVAAPIASPRSRAASAGTDEQIVVNVQGDEPLISPPLIAQVARLLACASRRDDRDARARRSTDAREFLDPNVVKVVTDRARLGAVLQPRADSVAARRRRARGPASHRSLCVPRRRPEGDQRGAAVRARGDREARAVACSLARLPDHRRATLPSRRRRTSIPRTISRAIRRMLEASSPSDAR